jgi:hypothetical protein
LKSTTFFFLFAIILTSSGKNVNSSLGKDDKIYTLSKVDIRILLRNNNFYCVMGGDFARNQRGGEFRIAGKIPL